MKLQCELCREIVAADFAVVDGAIEVRCPACAQAFVVRPTRAAASPAAGGEPPAEPPDRAAGRGPAPTGEPPDREAGRDATPTGEPGMECPKCGTAQPASAACRACGLAQDRMAAWAAGAGAETAEQEAAWRALEAGWDDPRAHDRFVERAAALHALPWAAQRYRRAARARPDDPRPPAQLARLATMAEATLRATARRPVEAAPGARRRIGAMLAVMAVIAAIGIGFAALSGSSTSRPTLERARPPARLPAQPVPAAPAVP